MAVTETCSTTRRFPSRTVVILIGASDIPLPQTNEVPVAVKGCLAPLSTSRTKAGAVCVFTTLTSGVFTTFTFEGVCPAFAMFGSAKQATTSKIVVNRAFRSFINQFPFLFTCSFGKFCPTWQKKLGDVVTRVSRQAALRTALRRTSYPNVTRNQRPHRLVYFGSVAK